jgi:hypothetical protein
VLTRGRVGRRQASQERIGKQQSRLTTISKSPVHLVRGFLFARFPVEAGALQCALGSGQRAEIFGAQGRTEMANREQRNNREKKKPKADKNKKKGPPQPVSAFAAQAPGMGKPGQPPIKK